MLVTKRDGRVEDFNKDRIYLAIIKAMKSTESVDYDLAKDISNKISNTNKDYTVEEIQDLVENKLMSSRRKDAAKEFITYRSERTRIRNKDKKLYKDIREMLSGSNIDNNNANIDQYSFSGKENRIGGEVHKLYAYDELLIDKVRKAFYDGYIYIHDFDKYSIGMHNCLYADVGKLLRSGFSTRNGDVRPANSVATAMQLIAVIFQVQSQVQFGGVASAHIDTDVAPFVNKSFYNHFTKGLKYIDNININDINISNSEFRITNNNLKKEYPRVYKYAYDMTYSEGEQGAEALYHNLNTLESRAGGQIPFTSINLGCDTTREGQLVTEWLLKASIRGIGKHHKTAIFPISIFQYKKGINDKPGTPNYYLKQLAIKSLTKRIYPNWVNEDYSQHHPDSDDPDQRLSRMGCRTAIGYDINGLGYKQVGRGNICPTTIILPKLGIENGICLGKRLEPDLDGFWKDFNHVLEITRESLLSRFEYISSQSPKSAPFMYENGTVVDSDKCVDTVYNSMKHNTLAFGFIGLAELCQALFGKDFTDDEGVLEFAESVIKRIYDYSKISTEKYKLNFSCYATPAENLCKTSLLNLRKQYGIIKNVTDRDYLTNSSHVPVWKKVTIDQKMIIESKFTKYETGGCITYVELDSNLHKNIKGVEDIIDYAMDLDIPYLAINFPIDTCIDCGYQGEMNDLCPECGCGDIEHLARVTGYLTTDVSHFNDGKKAEVKDRVDHSYSVDFGEESSSDDK